ncbi:MAG: DUF2062 domain-containing protein [Parasphingorhabdus sp.]|uniref:DUF2062 domain-containing protein n=1 Tax=Parasphingorhabdus sp. TaxID=2709688 RepID=UPI003298416D
MVFRRRDPRTPFQVATELVYPRGGWGRAFRYVTHRVRRLPDSPERIGRGIWAGVFAAFTPFYGLHFLIAFLIARVLQGNLLAALSSTFVGNPLTYVPIGVISLKSGHFLLGNRFEEGEHRSFVGKFADAWDDLQTNFVAMFTDATANWDGLKIFYDEIFYPYMVGCLIPGAVFGTVAYYLTVPVIRAYQQRRRAKIKAKFDEIRKKAEAEAGAAGNAG